MYEAAWRDVEFKPARRDEVRAMKSRVSRRNHDGHGRRNFGGLGAHCMDCGHRHAMPNGPVSWQCPECKSFNSVDTSRQ